MTITIGLTGSLGTGKSTETSMFGELGALTFNADKIAHDLIKKDRPCYRPLIQLLGNEILTGKSIDRKKVAAIVFKNKKFLKSIEKIIHPEVIKFIGNKIEDCSISKKVKNKVLVFDVPLLFESKLDKLMDLSIVVKNTQTNQISRASKNLGISKNQALLRIKAQMPLKEKIKRADIIIDNSKQIINTRKQVKKIWQKISQTMEKK